MENKPELLAPAGSPESFFAAMDSGADAVYCGLSDFSARARARNITLPQLERMLAYAHNLGRRIYVTLNTLVKERELSRVVDILAALSGMRADAIIVQDMGVARLARRHFPTLELHASTQMAIHNLPGVKMLEEMGFARVVLARELSIDDMAAIASATSVEIECFVHGALCFCISGQCHFSSLLGGHSGNRGRCAQPCRRLYSHRGRQGYYFSPNDLSAIDLVPRISRAGIRSLKIEGRMKSAEYVATVVKAYRMVLDAPPDRQKAAAEESRELLRNSFGRSSTKGFLVSGQPDDIVTPSLRGGTGRFLGEVRSLRNGRVVFETRDVLELGDRLRAQPKSDMAGSAWTIREICSGKRKVSRAEAGTLVEVPTPFALEKGDALFKVSSREAYTLSDSACARRLEAAGTDQFPCRIVMAFSDGTLRIDAEVSGSRHSYSVVLGFLEESRTSDMEGVLKAQFSKCGDTPFRLESLAAPGFPPLLIPSARFKEIRRDFYRFLEERVLPSFRSGAELAKEAALADIGEFRRLPRSHGRRESIEVTVDRIADWRYPFRDAVSSLIVPVTRANMHEFGKHAARMRGEAERIVWQLPFVVADDDIPWLEQSLAILHNSGFRRFEAANLSHFAILRRYDNMEMTAGYRCFTMNCQALAQWAEFGAGKATLNIEDDRDNIADLLALDSPVERRVIVYSHVAAMTTRIAMKDVHRNVPLHSDRGEEYSIQSRDGLNTLYSAVPFSILSRVGELRSMGAACFLIDLARTERDRWDEVVASFVRSSVLPGTTEFNYEMGLV